MAYSEVTVKIQKGTDGLVKVGDKVFLMASQLKATIAIVHS